MAHCPVCKKEAPRYDSKTRRWRHLDTMQFKTFLIAEVPRVQCPDDGVRQIEVPWAEPNSRFTAMFEVLVIDWLKEASIDATARQLRMTWDEVDGIMNRAVKRGLARRTREPVRELGVDETAFQKRHEYVTICSDLEKGRVLHVGDDRKVESLAEFFDSLSPEELAQIEAVATDMWDPFLRAIRENIPDALVCFDKFHIASHLGKAVDRVRKDEHRELQSRGDLTLSRSKYLWLQRPENMKPSNRKRFESLKDANLRVSRAWAMKETAMNLWNYRKPLAASKVWHRWLGWVGRSRLEPMKAVGRMIREHFVGVLNAVVLGVTNAKAEGLNSRIQWIKKMACGFRNRTRFKNAIYFHLGGLELYPATHTKA
ncbi:MAG: ISL3 family transposase [Acidobacteria bacterium]|nr:ISL3 family transposase [Acidobacteriota bacterium]